MSSVLSILPCPITYAKEANLKQPFPNYGKRQSANLDFATKENPTT